MKLKLSLSGQVAGQPIKAQRSETAQRQFNLRSGLSGMQQSISLNPNKKPVYHHVTGLMAKMGSPISNVDNETHFCK